MLPVCRLAHLENGMDDSEGDWHHHKEQCEGVPNPECPAPAREAARVEEHGAHQQADTQRMRRKADLGGCFSLMR